MARNPKVELRGHEGQVVHPITDGDCVIFPSGETLSHKLSEQEEVMYAPEVTNSSPMFKVGEGDSSDYSANVLDGAYQEVVLKGQTYVNTIQEPSADVIILPTPFTEYERTQSKTFTEMQDGTFGLNLVGQSYVNCIQEPSEPSYVALGENLEFQNKKVEYTTDGQIKSAMLNGMTLVNLFPKMNNREITLNSDFDSLANINQCSFKGQQTHEGAIDYTVQDIKPSTTYTIIYEIISNGITNTGGFLLNNVNDTTVFGKEIAIRSSDKPGIYKDTMTSKADLTSTYSVLRMQNGFARGSLEIGNIMLIEGDYTNVDIPYFEGMQSVTMTTELENVCSRYNSSVAKNGKTFTVGAPINRALYLSYKETISNYNFKQNTKYLMQFKITNLNLDGADYITLFFSDGTVASGNALFGNYTNTSIKVAKNGIYRTVLTTSNIVSTSHFIIKGLGSEWEETTSTTRALTISQIMCIEYQNGMENWGMPYFETTQLMKPLKVRSISKNLFNTANMFNSYKTTVSEVTTNSFRLTGIDSNVEFKNTPFIFNVKPNTDYKITFKSEATDADAMCDVYDANKKYLGTRNFNSGNNTEVSVRFYVNLNNTKNGTIKYYDVQMEESSTETTYTPHQSKTTSALEPITLRAIGNVKDTLDLSTGEYVQNVHEVILDGTGSISHNSSYSTDSTLCFDIFNNKKGKIYEQSSAGGLICDKFIPRNWLSFYSSKIDEEGIVLNRDNGTVLLVKIAKSKLATEDVNGFKQYLQQNPIKVQYELENPITRKISLEYPNLQTYTDITHVQSITMDGTLIPNIYLPSDISYKAMLKPNTSYNVIVDREVIDSTNQLTVNLGGTTANITANRIVVTTPSTLSNETLTFSGKDNRIAKAMLIEGSTLINGDLPHFDGIGDVKLGRVVENLCLSDEYPGGNGRTTDTYSNNSITSKFTVSGSRVYLFDLIKPIQNGKKYFVYAPCSQTCSIGFKTVYNGATLYSVAKTSIDNYTILSIDNEILKECRLFIGQLEAIPVDTTMTIRRPILCEYIDGMESWDWESIGYFTGTKNIGNEFMRIGNKNLFDWNSFKEKIKNESCFTILDNGFKADCSKGSVANFLKDKYKFAEGIFKENTQYTISWDATHEGDLYLSPFVTYTDGTHEGDVTRANGKVTLTTAANKTVKLFSVTWTTQSNNGKSTLTNIQIEEASTATSYVAHKHNSLHILPNEQIPLTFEQGRIDYTNNGTWANAINNTSTQVIRTQLLDLEPNETYRVSCGHSDFMFAVGLYNNSLLGSSVISYTSDRERYITTTKDVHKIGIATMRKDSTNITPSVLHQVRLEKVTDVTLRGFGGVRDELDLTRGVYIQRIGEIVLDGSEKWNLCTLAYQPTDTNYINYDLDIDNIKLSAPILCDSIKTRDWNISSIEFNSRSIAGHSTNRILRLCIEKTIAPDVESLKTYLSTNIVKVQYQLRTPIEHKINIPRKNELNQTIAKPNGIFTLPLMHSETNHIDINSQIYPKVQSRDYISYPVIGNNSQLHTIFHNKLGTGNLTVNLCGTSVTSVDGTSKCTVTTPSTISQYELRLSGARNKVSNVCVFSGDYMNVNVPYVQGMMNAVNPIVKNVGKNLFDGVVKNGESWWDGKIGIIARCRRSVNLTPVKPNTEYIFKLTNRYGIGCGANFMAHGKDGKFLKYIGWVLSETSKFTTPSDCYYIHWYNDIDDFTDFYIEESSTPSQYEPYKENILKTSWSIGYNAMLKGKSISSANGTSINNALNRYRTDFIKIDFAKIYINSNNPYCLFLYDINKKYLGRFTDSWVTDRVFEFNESNAYYFIVVFNTDDGEDITTYISSKETRITLRSLPNGVRDELNLQTGEYIQRIGEVVLDGSKDNVQHYASAEGITTSLFLILQDNVKNVTTGQNGSGNCYCDKFIEEFAWANSIDIESIWLQESNTNNILRFRIKKSKLQTVDNNGIKQYLSQNPITVQYELATPIVKHINIHNYPHSYKDGHVIIESNDPSTNVTAQMTYQCVANRTGQIQEHTEQVEKQEHEINELEMLILENIRQQQNR